MPARLTARKVATVGPGIYPDGGGLYLCVSASLNRTWIFRFSWRGRRPEMGLGSFDAGIGLAEARVARDEARRILTSGLNPIERRKEIRRVSRGKPTFGEIANALLEAKRPEWRNAKHKEQWRASLMKDALLDAAKAQGHRSGENPAAWRGHLSHLLPKLSNSAEI
jgi:hypothetical protein